LTDYEDYLYDDFPYEEAHPDRLATLATLFDLRPAPPERCRVLELGCGLGGNLIPMAEELRESTFVGVDLSAPQIESGLADIRALGLNNITLLAMNILEIDESIGTFDYILCHGVFSWVPPEVQTKILDLCRSQLAPNGVAYISYNTLPGWHLRGMIREALLREAGSAGTPEERIARARKLLGLLSMTPPESGYGTAWLRSEIEMLEKLSDSYILYEHLVKHNRPIYFKDFALLAARAGLQYLADSLFYTMVPDRFGPDVAARISEMSQSLIDAEHYMDLVDMRYFRRSLLCRREQRVNRAINARRLAGLWVSTPLRAASEPPDIRSDAKEVFRASKRTELSTSMPLLKAALVILERNQPRGLPLEELCVAARALVNDAAPEPPTQEDLDRLGGNILGLYAKNQVDLNVRGVGCAVTVSSKPKTTGLARLQARRGQPGCTTLRHRHIATDAFDRSLLARMDGTLTLEELVDRVASDVREGKVLVEVDGKPRSEREVLLSIAAQKLERMARGGFLSP
jgi:SAM-dependent methyltransferase